MKNVMYVINDNGIILHEKYKYLWKETAVNIELNLKRFVQMWQQ